METFKLTLTDADGVVLEQWVITDSPEDGWLPRGKCAGRAVAEHLGAEVVHEINKARGLSVIQGGAL